MATNSNVTDNQFRALAIEEHQIDDEIEIDADGVVSRNDSTNESHGCYVAAWVWVDNPEDE